MTDLILIQLNLKELSQVVGSSTPEIIEIVDQGIIEPEGREPENWLFDDQMLCLIQKALRLHNDLEIDWPGIALAISLIEEVDFLRAENKSLKSRLGKLLLD